MSQGISTAEADVAEGGRGLARLNPQPRLAYEVTLKIKDAPGPFALVKGGAQYDVVNEAECGRINPATGTAGRITSHEEVVLRRVAEDEYRGTLYLDLLQDDDYFGRGVCRWEFTGASVTLRATGVEGETRFLSFITAGAVMNDGVVTRYYPLADYVRAKDAAPTLEQPTTRNFPQSGKESPDDYLPKFRGALFSMSLHAQEVE